MQLSQVSAHRTKIRIYAREHTRKKRFYKIYIASSAVYPEMKFMYEY